jgi:hypothetical protein
VAQTLADIGLWRCLLERKARSAASAINLNAVIPAKAGIHAEQEFVKAKWIPALAGMTREEVFRN